MSVFVSTGLISKARTSYENLRNRWRHTQRAGDGALCVGFVWKARSTEDRNFSSQGLTTAAKIMSSLNSRGRVGVLADEVWICPACRELSSSDDDSG